MCNVTVWTGQFLQVTCFLTCDLHMFLRNLFFFFFFSHMRIRILTSGDKVPFNLSQQLASLYSLAGEWVYHRTLSVIILA